MKLIFSRYFLTISFLLFSAISFGKTFEVLEYNSKNYLLSSTVELHDLLSSTHFDGKYFKIVSGKSNDAIAFNSDLKLRAAHVYYHLSKARNFFLNLPSVNKAHFEKKTTIRIELTNNFDPYAKFAHDEFEPSHNTAVTIPASTDARLDIVAPWSEEIWFRPAKVITNNLQALRTADSLEQGNTIRQMQITIVQFQLNQILLGGLTSGTWNSFTSDYSLLYMAAGLFAIQKLPAILRVSGRLFPSTYYLDTAMIPEIIYHEYAHLALSDHLELESTPVIEGLANYYAGKISNKFHWGNGPGMYSRDNGRNATSKEIYSFASESKRFATSNFVFKMLWGLQGILGEHNTNKLVYLCRMNLDKKSEIKTELVKEIFNQLPKINKNDLTTRMILHDYFQRLGI